MIIFIDKIEKYIRLNMGFEVVKGEFERVDKEYLDSFKKKITNAAFLMIGSGFFTFIIFAYLLC